MSIYMNNAATTWPKPPQVAAAMAGFLAGGGANLARGSASRRDLGTLDMVLSCRERLASLLGGWDDDPRFVTFTANVTESLNVVLKGFMKPGMTVLTSSMEHNGVLRPLRRLEAGGIKVEILECDSEGFLPPEILAAALKEKSPSLAVFNHCSNVCGTLQDLPALAEICRASGVPLVADCAQTAGVVPLSAREMGLAALCFTGHKGLFGPQGIGGILWNPEFASATECLLDGGTGSFSHLERQPGEMPDKYEAGTPNLPGIAGLLAALEWIEATGLEAIRRREEEAGKLLLEGLLSLPEISISGRKTMKGRLPVFAANFPGRDNGTLAARLSEEWGIEGRPGLHCAPRAHRTLGTYPGGSLRLSPGYFTTGEEISLTAKALKSLLDS